VKEGTDAAAVFCGERPRLLGPAYRVLPFDEVAATVGRTPGSCRQLAVRARRKVHRAAPRRPSPGDQVVVDRLLLAVATGDVEGAMELLADDIVLTSDGGPTRRAARRPVVGPWRVGRLLVNLARRASPDASHVAITLNGGPGLWVSDPVFGDAAIAFDVVDQRIQRTWIVNAPDKLRTPLAIQLI
jgi:RNA polymerase sigma-70 factor (ECF subfamily)